MTTQTRQALIVSLGFVLACTLRLTGVEEGLPYLHHWDEPSVMARAVEMVQTGDLNPHFFNYPSLTIYLNALGLVLAQAVGVIDAGPGLQDVTTGTVDYPWFISHPRVYLVGRSLHAVLGALCVLPIWFLALRVCGSELAAAFGVVLFALNPLHLQLSRWIATDAVATTLAIASIAAAARWKQTKLPRALWCSAILAGLAASTKYNLGLVGLTLVPWVALHAQPGRRSRTVTLFAAVLGLGFLLASPFVLLDAPAFIDGVSYELGHYLVDGHDGFSAARGLPHLTANLNTLWSQFGLVGMVLAAVGGISMWAGRNGWAGKNGRTGKSVWDVQTGRSVVVLILLQVALTALTTVHFERNLLLAVALCPVLIAAGAVQGWNVAVSLFARRHKALVYLTGLLLPALALESAVQASLPRAVDRLRDEGDSRTLAATHLGASVCRTESTIKVDRYLRLHPHDLEALAKCNVGEVDPIEMLCFPERSDYRLLGERYHSSLGGSDQEQASEVAGFADEVLSSTTAMQSWGTRATQTTHYNVNPRIHVLGPDQTALPTTSRCADLVGDSDLKLAAEGSGRDARGWLELGSSDTAISFPVWYSGGELTATWIARAPSRLEGQLELRATVRNTPQGEELLTRQLSAHRLRRVARRQHAVIANAPAGFVSFDFSISGASPSAAVQLRDFQLDRQPNHSTTEPD